MKISFSKKSLPKLLKQRLGLIIYISIFLVIIWLGYFTYQNLYLTVIAPKEIDQSEIIAKKQKVNLELFNTINQKIVNKKDISSEALLEIKNPFE